MQMAFQNDHLDVISEEIRTTLGEIYLGVHARVGDGHFAVESAANVRKTWWRLVQNVMGLDLEDIIALEADTQDTNEYYNWEPPSISEDRAAIRTTHPPLSPLPYPPQSPQLTCHGPLHKQPGLLLLNTPLYISTDSSHPKTDPALRIFLGTFPCTFFLADFDGTLSRSLKDIKNELDGLSIWPFMRPVLDAMVAANAWAVVGTDGSTYSRFMEDVLWRKYRGWNIVQRG